MNILIATGIYQPEIGGPATVSAMLAHELRAVGHTVTIVTYGECSVQRDNVIRVSRLGSVLFRYFRFARDLKRQVRSDMIVLVTDVFSVGIPARWTLVGRKNRLVVRLGGEWIWEDAVNRGARVTLLEYWTEYAHGMRHHIKRMLAGWVLRRAARIVVTSDMLRMPIGHIAPSIIERIVTVPNRVYEYRSLADRRGTACHASTTVSSDSHKNVRVLYAGRFVPVKNVPLFARALTRALEAGAPISMTFVGDGPERAICEKILSGMPSVRFLGSKQPQDISHVLHETDLYVLPSLSDICPNGVVEALSCGVPCLITSEHGLSPEIEGVMECDPKNEQAWIEALIRFARDRAALTVLSAQIHLPKFSSLTLAEVLTSSVL